MLLLVMVSGMFSYLDIFTDKQKILFITAHPDDVDVFYGGLLCLLNRDKKDTFVLITTNGARGSKQNQISESKLAGIRLKEEAKALSHLGLKDSHLRSLNHLDGEIENSLSLIGEISAVIREFKPDIVCTHDPAQFYYSSPDSGFGYINHRDHRQTGLSTLDAVYPFSRDRSFFPDQNLSSHQVQHLLLCGHPQPNTQIDITSCLDQKRLALLEHQSQFTAPTVDKILARRQQDGSAYESAFYLQLAW